MGWVKLDDGFFNNRKIVTASKDAKLLYLAAICHAGATDSDGELPLPALTILAAQTGVRAPAKVAQELVDAGLWHKEKTMFTIHDYLEHNTSASERDAKREAARLRMNRRRSLEQNDDGSPDVRANTSRTSREQNEMFAERSHGRARPAEAEAEAEELTPKTSQVLNESLQTPQQADKPPEAGAQAKSNGRSADLPDNGPAQRIVKAFCETMGIDRPVNYAKSVGNAKTLVNAKITPEHIPDIVHWLQGQAWVNGAIDLSLVVNQADKWRASQNGKRSGGPPGVQLLPGEVFTEIAPGHWELETPDGRKRTIKPEYHGVVFDQRQHLGTEGLARFYDAVHAAGGDAA